MPEHAIPSGQASRKAPGFFDVFISYRHHDASRIDELADQVRLAGFQPFRDLAFPRFQDTGDVTRAKILAMREILSQATCLIFAYSRESAERQAGAEMSTVGSWMPWELGFFDGCISDRIGVYLLDGDPEEFVPQEYFRHAEFLQLYQPLVARKTTHAGDELPPRQRIIELEPFLNRFAVRERRVDNVRAGFVWAEHMVEECLANPANVVLGVAEWHVDHWARHWRSVGAEVMSDDLYQLKEWLDHARVTWAPNWRSPLVDAWIGAKYAHRQATVRQRTEALEVGPSTSPPPSETALERPSGVPDQWLAAWPAMAPLQDLDISLDEPATLAPGRR